MKWTKEDLIALTAACPITMEHAAQSAGYNTYKDARYGNASAEGLAKHHADLTSEWCAAMMDELEAFEGLPET